VGASPHLENLCPERPQSGHAHRARPPDDLSPEDRDVFDPLRKLARGRLPLLVMHGSNDTMISAEEARRAHAAAGSPRKQLVLIPDRGHNDVSYSDVYWDALAAFVGPPQR